MQKIRRNIKTSLHNENISANRAKGKVLRWMTSGGRVTFPPAPSGGGENERKNLCDWQNENLMNARNRVE
jgi:hypothetical protein